MTCFWNKLVNTTCIPAISWDPGITLNNMTLDVGVTFDKGWSPTGLEWDVENSSIYIARWSPNQVYKYTGMTNGDISTVAFSSLPWDVAGPYPAFDIAKIGSVLYSPDINTSVMGDSVATYPGYDLPNKPSSVAGGTNYVAANFGLNLHRMSGSTVLESLTISTIGIPHGLYAMYLLSDGRTLIATSNSGSALIESKIYVIVLGPGGTVSDAVVTSEYTLDSLDIPDTYMRAWGVLVNEPANKLYLSMWPDQVILQYSLN